METNKNFVDKGKIPQAHAGILSETLAKLPRDSDQIEQIISYIQSLADLEDGEKQKQEIKLFIHNRIQVLQEQGTKETEVLSLMTKKAEERFINPDTEIKRSWMVDGFKLNDLQIYDTLLHTLFRIYQHQNKPPLRTVMMDAIVYALGDYFGNHFATGKTESNNIKFYSDHSDTDSHTIDLVEFKEKKIAVCAEKATVAHNYLKFFGVDSHIIFSSACQIGNTDEAHAYIIFATKNGRFIFDPTNPVFIKNTSDEIKYLKPALYLITEEDYIRLCQRDEYQVTVQHINQTLDQETYIPQESQSRIYG